VAHVVPALFGRDGVVGGAERYVLELARHMADVTDTTLVTFGERSEDRTLGRLAIRTVGPAKYVRGERSNPFAWRAVREALAADVVHCHQQHVVASTVTALAGRLRGHRVVCTDLGGGGWDLSSYISTDRLYRAHLHISEYSRHVFGHDGRPNAYVIYGGVDADRFSPGPSADRQIDALFVGRLLPHKGVDVLLEGVPADFRTVVMGTAPHARYLADLHAAAAGKNVTFVHDADDAGIIRAYQTARCVVLPSVYRDRYGALTNVPELLGQTLLEGMACGAVGLATAVASLPEVVTDGDTGRVVPPNDPAALGEALVWFKTHPSETAGMAARARDRVLSRFSWPATVERCFEAYAS
jgi:glycosyltransferase involved in cell wall biosynthesis